MDEGRVLDIPAIPYAVVEQQHQERKRAIEEPSPKGGTRKRRQARKPKRGELGPQIAAAVDAKTKTGMNRTQAFAAVAEERGSKPGAVAANYYRVQRKQNPKALKPRSSRKRSQPSKTETRASTRPTTAPARGSRSGASDGAVDIDKLAGDLVSAVNALASAVSAQQRETEQLRARLDEARSALG